MGDFVDRPTQIYQLVLMASVENTSNQSNLLRNSEMTSAKIP